MTILGGIHSRWSDRSDLALRQPATLTCQSTSASFPLWLTSVDSLVADQTCRFPSSFRSGTSLASFQLACSSPCSSRGSITNAGCNSLSQVSFANRVDLNVQLISCQRIGISNVSYFIHCPSHLIPTFIFHSFVSLCSLFFILENSTSTLQAKTSTSGSGTDWFDVDSGSAADEVNATFRHQLSGEGNAFHHSLIIGGTKEECHGRKRCSLYFNMVFVIIKYWTF